MIVKLAYTNVYLVASLMPLDTVMILLPLEKSIYLCANSIQFIYEDDCRGLLFSESKSISHKLGSITNEHLV